MQSFLVVGVVVVVVAAVVVEELEDGFAFPVLDFLEAGLGDLPKKINKLKIKINKYKNYVFYVKSKYLLEAEDEEVVEKFEGPP